jgi:hypothetical protein
MTIPIPTNPTSSLDLDGDGDFDITDVLLWIALFCTTAFAIIVTGMLFETKKAAAEKESRMEKEKEDLLLVQEELLNEKEELLRANDAAMRNADVALGLLPEGELAGRTKECLVCYEVLDVSKGLCCPAPERHFACAGCIAKHVKERCGAESLRLVEKVGGIGCIAGCKSVYSDRSLAYTLGDAQFKEYCHAKERIAEERIVAEVERDVKARLAAAEPLELQHKNRIIDSVINFKCPGCDAVFYDHTGCAAMTCARPNCGTGFCGLCFRHCGRDAHRHVREECLLNTRRDFFVSEDELKKAHLKERCRKLVLYLNNLPNEDEREKALKAAERELTDVGVDTKMFQGEQLALAGRGLVEAATKGELDVVRGCIERGDDVDAEVNEDGCTALWMACGEGHLEITKMLLEEGADKDTADNIGRTPLCAASYYGHTEVATMLVAKGADKDKAMINGITPLKAASYKGHTEIVNYLKSEGAKK